MRSIFCILFFVGILCASSIAQVEPMDSRIREGGFGAFNMSFKRLQGNTAVYTGGGGGFIVNDFRIGVFFSGLTNNYSKRDTSNVSYKLGSSYGGLWLSYPFINQRDYHPIIDLRVSYGNMRLINTNWQVWDDTQFFGFSLGAGIEYKLTNIFFISGGIKYHHSLLLDSLTAFSDNDFNSVGIYISIKLGLFEGTFH